MKTEKFWSFVYKTPDCWFWIGQLNDKGYGNASAHRKSWIIKNGPIPRGLCVLHSCDIRQCVNPSHLFLGTRKDNTLDAVSKGTINSQYFFRTHCSRGHEYTLQNTKIRNHKPGKHSRRCLTCVAEDEKRYPRTKTFINGKAFYLRPGSKLWGKGVN